jgi:hypothetical protein
MKENYHKIFEDFSREIIIPAGEFDQFSSIEGIKEDSENFILNVHSTWKKWHSMAIDQILTFDYMEKADKVKPIGRSFREWTIYMRQVWRRVNDAIVWSMFGDQRHLMKRLCLYRKRGPLVDANPESALNAIDLINSDPLSVGIWNDATSCVDIGDVTFVSKRINQYSFIELKEGKVNEEILKLNQSKDDPEYLNLYEEFIEKYGKHGIKQIQRIERQEERSKQILELINKEKGIDPVTSQYMEIQEIRTPDEFYDNDLNRLLKNVSSKNKEDICLIDDCLWIYANSNLKTSLIDAVKKFKDVLISKNFRLKSLLTKKLPPWDGGKIITLNAGFNFPISRPIFLRDINPELLGHIADGDLTFRIYLYLDWEKFGNLFRNAGIEFSWSSCKKALREKTKVWHEQTSVIIYGRLPQIRYEDVYGTIPGSNIIRILFDGIKPKTIVAQTLETYKTIIENSKKTR